MPNTSKPPHEREQAQAYIFDISVGLVKVAKNHRLDFLVYLLEMAVLEASEKGGLAKPRTLRRGR